MAPLSHPERGIPHCGGHNIIAPVRQFGGSQRLRLDSLKFQDAEELERIVGWPGKRICANSRFFGFCERGFRGHVTNVLRRQAPGPVSKTTATDLCEARG